MPVLIVHTLKVRRGLHSQTGTAVCVAAALFTVFAARAAQAQEATSQTQAQPQPVAAWQKLAGGKMEFEVASVRPSAPGSSLGANMSMNTGDYLRPNDGLFTANSPLITYIVFAYKLTLDHEQEKLLLGSLPKWAANQMFSVQARAFSATRRKINTD